MSYKLAISISLGTDLINLSLSAQVVDQNGQDVTSEITSGFSEIGSGTYLWYYDQFTSNFYGGIKFWQTSDPSIILAFTSVNPEDFELIVSQAVNTDTASSNQYPYLANLISLERARMNEQLSDLTDDDLLLRIALGSSWLWRNVEIGPYETDIIDPYDPYGPTEQVYRSVEPEVQEACVRLILRLANTENINLALRSESIGDYSYALNKGSADTEGTASSMVDIKLLLQGYRWRPKGSEDPRIVPVTIKQNVS